MHPELIQIFYANILLGIFSKIFATKLVKDYDCIREIICNDRIPFPIIALLLDMNILLVSILSLKALNELI